MAADPPSIEFAGLVDESGQYELKIQSRQQKQTANQ
jgi:hypothetical protein